MAHHPGQKKGRYHQLINEVELEQVTFWKPKVLNTLQTCYGKAPYFKDYFPALENILNKEHRLLVDLNVQLIQWIAQTLGIKTKVLTSSHLENITGESTQRLVSICRAVNGDAYLSGFGGQKYQEKEIFEENHIDLKIYDFQHPVYPQLFGEFSPGLSAVDILFNRGPDSGKLILGGPNNADAGQTNGESAGKPNGEQHGL